MLRLLSAYVRCLFSVRYDCVGGCARLNFRTHSAPWNIRYGSTVECIRGLLNCPAGWWIRPSRAFAPVAPARADARIGSPRQRELESSRQSVRAIRQPAVCRRCRRIRSCYHFLHTVSRLSEICPFGPAANEVRVNRFSSAAHIRQKSSSKAAAACNRKTRSGHIDVGRRSQLHAGPKPARPRNDAQRGIPNPCSLQSLERSQPRRPPSRLLSLVFRRHPLSHRPGQLAKSSQMCSRRAAPSIASSICPLAPIIPAR